MCKLFKMSIIYISVIKTISESFASRKIILHTGIYYCKVPKLYSIDYSLVIGITGIGLCTYSTQVIPAELRYACARVCIQLKFIFLLYVQHYIRNKNQYTLLAFHRTRPNKRLFVPLTCLWRTFVYQISVHCISSVHCI